MNATYIQDCVSDAFYKDLWLRRAVTNTRAYDDAFLVVPTDSVRTMEACQKYETRTPLAEFDRMAAQAILSSVKARIILYGIRGFDLAAVNCAPPFRATWSCCRYTSSRTRTWRRRYSPKRASCPPSRGPRFDLPVVKSPYIYDISSYLWLVCIP